MIARRFSLALTAAAVLALTACSEQPQGMGGVKSDQAPYTGVGKSQYAQPGWQAGDKLSAITASGSGTLYITPDA